MLSPDFNLLTGTMNENRGRFLLNKNNTTQSNPCLHTYAEFKWENIEIDGVLIDKQKKCVYYKDKESGEPPPYKRGIKKAVIPDQNEGNEKSGEPPPYKRGIKKSRGEQSPLVFHGE